MKCSFSTLLVFELRCKQKAVLELDWTPNLLIEVIGEGGVPEQLFIFEQRVDAEIAATMLRIEDSQPLAENAFGKL